MQKKIDFLEWVYEHQPSAMRHTDKFKYQAYLKNEKDLIKIVDAGLLGDWLEQGKNRKEQVQKQINAGEFKNNQDLLIKLLKKFPIFKSENVISDDLKKDSDFLALVFAEDQGVINQAFFPKNKDGSPILDFIHSVILLNNPELIAKLTLKDFTLSTEAMLSIFSTDKGWAARHWLPIEWIPEKTLSKLPSYQLYLNNEKLFEPIPPLLWKECLCHYILEKGVESFTTIPPLLQHRREIIKELIAFPNNHSFSEREEEGIEKARFFEIIPDALKKNIEFMVHLLKHNPYVFEYMDSGLFHQCVKNDFSVLDIPGILLDMQGELNISLIADLRCSHTMSLEEIQFFFKKQKNETMLTLLDENKDKIENAMRAQQFGSPSAQPKTDNPYHFYSQWLKEIKMLQGPPTKPMRNITFSFN